MVRCTDTLPLSPYFQDYFACAFTSAVESATHAPSPCAPDCGAGDNWDCVGVFSWDLQSQAARVFNASPVWTTIQIIDLITEATAIGGPLPPFQGAQIASCNDGFPAAKPPGDTGCGDSWVNLHGYGWATLNMANDDVVAVRGIGFGEKQRIYPRPTARSGSMLLSLTTSVGLGIIASSFPGYDPTLGVIDAFQVDCLGVQASADIQVTTPSGSPRRGYLLGLGRLDPLAQYGSYAVFINVPGAQAVAITSSLAGGQQVSKRSVLVAVDWPTTVFLYPMSKQQAGR